MKILHLILTALMLNLCLWGIPHMAYPQPTIILEDDFTDNRNNWWVGNEEGIFTVEVNDGRYLFTSRKESPYNGVYILKLLRIDETKNFQITAILHKIEGRNSGNYGIRLGAEDLENRYEFLIEGNGYYYYGKTIHGTQSDIIEWTHSEYLSTGNSINTLSIKKVGEWIEFYINSHYVNTAKFEEFFGDYLGFAVGRDMTIAIDYVRIEQLSSHERPFSGE